MVERPTRARAEQIVRQRLKISQEAAARIVRPARNELIAAICQSASQSTELGDALLVETVYQARIEAAERERTEYLKELARRRRYERLTKPTGSRTRRPLRDASIPTAPSKPPQRTL